MSARDHRGNGDRPRLRVEELEDRSVPAAGALDVMFGDDGRATPPLAPGAESVGDIALQADGKVVAVGTHTDPAGRGDFLVFRLTSAGALDSDPSTGFGPTTAGPGSPRSGFVTLDLGSAVEEGANAVSIDSEGRIVVGGHTRLGSLALAVVRLNPDGTPDGTFGTAGRVVTDVSPGHDAILDLAVREDGAVVGVGYANNAGVPTSDFVTVLYSSTGVLDPGFAAGGIAVFNFGTRHHDVAEAVTIQSDGRILVGGVSSRFFPGSSRNDPDLALLRYEPWGALDPSFANGKTNLQAGNVFFDNSAEGITDLAVLSDGRIVAAGSVAFDSFSGGHLPGDFMAAVFTPTGSLDGSFDYDGWRSVDFGGNADSAARVVVQSDGKIILAGSTSTPGGQSDAAVLRLTVTGEADASFGAAGKVTTDFGTGSDAVRALALQADGRLVAAGQAGGDGVVVRYEGDAPTRFDIIVSAVTQVSHTSFEYEYATVGTPGLFEVGLYRSADESFDAGDDQIAAQFLTAGDAGAFHLAGPLAFDPARPFVLVVADPAGLLEEGDESNNVAATRLKQPPAIQLGGAVGEQDDGREHVFLWEVTDPDDDLNAVWVEVLHDGAAIYTSTAAAGQFRLNAFGLGEFLITVTASDAGGATRTVTRTATVTDDDSAPPDITLGGSLGTESDSQAQSFSWSVVDASGFTFLSVVVTRDTGNGPEVVFNSTDPAAASGGISLETYGPGTYDITVAAIDGDGDRPGDGLSASAQRAVVVVPDGVRIYWRNRGGSQDGFDTVFGARAPTVRRVVDAAIKAWARVITSFNYATGPDTFVLDVVAGPSDPVDPAFGGEATHDQNGNERIDPEEVDDRGMPRRGRLGIGGGDGSGSAGDLVNGWFIDPTPEDSSEFTASIANAFAGRRGDATLDLFTVAVLEMTHLLGLSPTTGLVLVRDLDPTRDGINGRNPGGGPFTITDTGVADDAEGRHPVTGDSRGTFWVFQGSSVDALLTSNNGGPPPNGQDLLLPVHTAGVRRDEASLTFNGITVSGAEDSGNAVFERGTRYLPSNLDALLLKDVYGYSITMPETFGTFYSLLNQNSGELLVRGSVGDDIVSILSNGDAIEVRVDIGADVPGTGPTDELVTVFDASKVLSIRIETGFGGIDSVTLIRPGVPVDVRGGGVLADSLHIIGTSGDDTIVTTVRSVTINGVPITVGSMQLTVVGGGGNDLFVVNGSQTTLLGGAGTDTFVVNATGAHGLLLDGRGGSDDYTINIGNLAGGVTVADSGGPDDGADAVTITGTPGDDTLVLSEGQVALGSQTVRFSRAVERLVVDGAGGTNRVIVEGRLTVPTEWRNAAGAGVTGGVLRVVGTEGSDHVHVNEQGNGRIKVHSSFLPNGFAVYDSAGIERIHVLLGGGRDIATVAGGVKKVTILDGGAGDDLLAAGGGPSILLGGSGNDTLNGGNGRNILVGGVGSDMLVGNGGNDIFIGGTTAYDADEAALSALLGVWVSEEYAGGVRRLREGEGVPLLRKGLTVFGDDEPDVLVGAGGLDWLFSEDGRDRLADRRPNEFID
ncbi:MAG TPA: hypothetical protein VD866_04440 [Urbifossiella sp.]|nr:hypothetical protein [Urbifossiella sp.]